METEPLDPLFEALLHAVAKADNNQTRFAAGIGTSQQLVSYWLKNRRPMPAEFVLAAEAAGFGSRFDLRPDIYPPHEFRTHDATSAIDDEPAAVIEAPRLVCDMCDEMVGNPAHRTCAVVDCPHRAKAAA